MNLVCSLSFLLPPCLNASLQIHSYHLNFKIHFSFPLTINNPKTLTFPLTINIPKPQKPKNLKTLSFPLTINNSKTPLPNPTSIIAIEDVPPSTAS